MKQNLFWKIIKNMVIIFAILIIIVAPAIVLEYHSKDCLQNYANEYCESNNLASEELFSNEETNFYCYKIEYSECDERNVSCSKEKNNTTPYKFLKKELESCKIKDSWTFKNFWKVFR